MSEVIVCECCGYDEDSSECICVGWDVRTRKCNMHQPKVTGKTNPVVFEVINIDGAIEKQDSDELTTYDEMTRLNEEFIAFLEERGYGFGGVMRGVELGKETKP